MYDSHLAVHKQNQMSARLYDIKKLLSFWIAAFLYRMIKQELLR